MKGKWRWLRGSARFAAAGLLGLGLSAGALAQVQRAELMIVDGLT